MPQNLNLEPVTLPMPLRFGEDPQTQFVNDLATIDRRYQQRECKSQCRPDRDILK